MKAKISYWLHRYLPAELSGNLLSIVAGYVIRNYATNQLLIAYGTTFFDSLGYFSVIIIRHILYSAKHHRTTQKRYTRYSLTTDLVLLFAEFGFAEILDIVAIRPYFIYTFPLAIKPLGLAILTANCAATIVFYLIAIIIHERLHFKRSHTVDEP